MTIYFWALIVIPTDIRARIVWVVLVTPTNFTIFECYKTVTLITNMLQYCNHATSPSS